MKYAHSCPKSSKQASQGSINSQLRTQAPKDGREHFVECDKKIFFVSSSHALNRVHSLSDVNFFQQQQQQQQPTTAAATTLFAPFSIQTLFKLFNCGRLLIFWTIFILRLITLILKKENVGFPKRPTLVYEDTFSRMVDIYGRCILSVWSKILY